MPSPLDHNEEVIRPTSARSDLWSYEYNQKGWKLLVDLGWSKGVGLGKNKQGNVDYLKVKQKLDKRGIGYKRKPEEWFKHQEALEEILANLSKMNSDAEDELETCESEKKVSSLEGISKRSKSRVHYKKFTRGKDLSLCTEKDLACIIGPKKKKDDTVVAAEVNYSNDDSEDIFTSGGSMRDYFSKKMDALKRKREEGLLGDMDSSSLKQEEELTIRPSSPLPDLDFEPAKTNFSFNISVQQPDTEGTEIDQSLKLENKKKRKMKEIDEKCEAKDENLHIKPHRKSEKKKKNRPDQILCKKLKQIYGKNVLNEITGGSIGEGEGRKRLKKGKKKKTNETV